MVKRAGTPEDLKFQTVGRQVDRHNALYCQCPPCSEGRAASRNDAHQAHHDVLGKLVTICSVKARPELNGSAAIVTALPDGVQLREPSGRSLSSGLRVSRGRVGVRVGAQSAATASMAFDEAAEEISLKQECVVLANSKEDIFFRRTLAFCMSLHPRLGLLSAASALEDDLLRAIVSRCDQCGKPSCSCEADSLEEINSNILKDAKVMLACRRVAGWLQTSDSRRTVLNLSSHFDKSGGDAEAFELAAALSRSTMLTRLELAFNSIGVAGTTKLAEALGGKRMLQTLNLSGNRIGAEGAAVLAESLSTLTSLNLGGTKFGDRGATSIAAAVARNTMLRELGLGSNEIRVKGASKMAEALGSNCVLQTLILHENCIDADGASMIAESLATNAALTSLDLSSCNIGDGASQLSLSLADNATLTCLNLSQNDIDAAGASDLAAALARNGALKVLRLDGNSIGDAGSSKLAEALACNQVLQEVYLSRNHIGSEGAGALAASLAHNTAMTHLHLRYNTLEESGVRKFAEILAVNSSLTCLSFADWSQRGDEFCFRQETQNFEDFHAKDIEYWEREKRYWEIEADVARSFGHSLLSRPCAPMIEIQGVSLHHLLGMNDCLGLPPRGCCWGNKEIVEFFREQQQRRMAVCMIRHERLGAGSLWMGLEGRVLRMVLAHPIYYLAGWYSRTCPRRLFGRYGYTHPCECRYVLPNPTRVCPP